jgi:hypothetical protein
MAGQCYWLISGFATLFSFLKELVSDYLYIRKKIPKIKRKMKRCVFGMEMAKKLQGRIAD